MSDRNKEHTTKAQVNEMPPEAVTASGTPDAGGHGPDNEEENAGRKLRSPSYPPEDTSQQKIVIDDTVVDISGFRFIDDEMGKVGFDNFTEGAELLANASLGRDDLRVISSVTQRSLSSVGHRGLCIDIYARGSDGAQYNIEIQRSRGEAPPERALFQMGMMTSHVLRKHSDLRDLPKTYVIFYNEHDELKSGEPVESFGWHNNRTGKLFSEKQTIVYVNKPALRPGTLIYDVMHDLYCTQASEMRCPVLARRMDYLKNTEEGRKTMDSQIEAIMKRREDKGRAEGEARGEARGTAAAKRENAIKMLADGLALDKVVLYSGLSMEDVEELAAAV